MEQAALVSLIAAIAGELAVVACFAELADFSQAHQLNELVMRNDADYRPVAPKR